MNILNTLSQTCIKRTANEIWMQRCSECGKWTDMRQLQIGFKITAYYDGQPSHGGAGCPECVAAYNNQNLQPFTLENDPWKSSGKMSIFARKGLWRNARSAWKTLCAALLERKGTVQNAGKSA